jgi:thioredoxin-related protein
MKNPNMIIRFVIVVLFFLSISAALGQDKEAPIKIYNPEADAKAEIAQAVEKAKAEGKHVFLQIGGNWCVWCIRFHKFYHADSTLNTFMHENFEVLKVNYSKENRNEEILTELGFPQRFGFPVFIILDGDGNRLHTQNTAFLEKDGGYDQQTVLRFLKNWSPGALNPEKY